jgi:hypothetical protein
MSKAPATVVREGLQAYVDRKIFRNFVEVQGKDGRIKFRFLYLGKDVLNLDFKEQERTLVIRNLLPRVSAGMYLDLQAFLERLYDPDLPAYRRIDRGSADVHFEKRAGNVSLVFRVKSNRYKYGVDKLIELASWIRTFLQGRYQTYLWEVMGEPVD